MNLGEELKKLVALSNQIVAKEETVDKLTDKKNNLFQKLYENAPVFDKDGLFCGIDIENDTPISFSFYLHSEGLNEDTLPSKKTIKELCDFLMEHFG